MNWADALKNCRNDGGSLLSIGTNHEWSFIKHKLNRLGGFDGAWFGYAKTESKFTDGTEIKPTHWHNGYNTPEKRPDDTYGAIFGFSWQTRGIDQKRESACKKKGISTSFFFQLLM